MCKIFRDLSGLSRTLNLGRYLLLIIHKTFLFIVVYQCVMFYSIIHPKVYLLLLWVLRNVCVAVKFIIIQTQLYNKTEGNVVAPVNRDRSKSTPETIPH